MPDTLRLRPFHISDIDRLYQIDRVCFSAGIAYSKAELRHFLNHPTAFIRVAIDEKEAIAGFCIAHSHRYEGEVRGHVITIDVLPEYRRRGIGKALIEAMEGHFLSLGVRFLRLEAAIENVGALDFYQQLGFARIGRIPGYYAGGGDAFVLEKTLLVKY